MNPLLIKRFATFVTVLLVMAMSIQLAWWGWHFFAPRTSSTTSAATDTAIDLSAARQLFGDVSSAASTAPAENNSGIRLKGVYAVDGKTLSAAVVNVGARDVSVRLNEKISDNVTLVEVKADHIVVSRAGVQEKINLDRAGIKGAVSANTNAPQSSFRLNVATTARNTFNLSRSELNNVLQDPRQVNFLGSVAVAPNGGVQVSDAQQGTLAQKLGLQAGDIITSINGQPVNGTGDLARFYGQFGSTNNIRAEIKRGGSPMLLVYAINP